jgi:uncharacterized protein YaeQ
MGSSATLYRFHIVLSDVDRSVYETLDLRVAQHPSESEEFLAARVVAYCAAYEEGLAFSRGLSTADEPALWTKTSDGEIATWIDIGLPSAERLHRASKLARRVIVFTHKRVELLQRQCAGERIHRAEEIRVLAIDPVFIGELVRRLDRNVRWELAFTGGHLFATVGGATFETRIEEHELVVRGE